MNRQRIISLVAVSAAVLSATASIQADVIGNISPNPQPRASASDWLRKARQALQGNQPDICRSHIAEARELRADLPHTEIVIARWLLESGQPIAARTLAEQLSVQEPHRVDLRILFAQLAVSQGHWFDAWEHLAAAEQAEFPQDWSEKYREEQRREILSIQSHVASQRADWENAKRLYTTLLKATDRPQHRLELAKALLYLHEHDQAEALIRQACESPDIDASAELILARLYQQAGDRTLCEEWFRRGTGLAGEPGLIALLEFNRWLLAENRPDEVLKTLARVQPPPDRADDFTFVAALAHRMIGNMKRAESLLIPLHHKQPANLVVSNQLALVLVESSDEGKRSRALQIATANAKRQSQLEDVVATLGWVQFRLGDPVQAEQTLISTSADGAISRDTAFYLSRVKQALGKDDESMQLADAARSGRGEFFNRGRLNTDQ